MPSWNQVLEELHECPRKDALDYVRRSYLQKLSDKRGRNVIAYIHHCYMHTFANSPAIKIVENQSGKAVVALEYSRNSA